MNLYFSPLEINRIVRILREDRARLSGLLSLRHVSEDERKHYQEDIKEIDIFLRKFRTKVIKERRNGNAV